MGIGGSSAEKGVVSDAEGIMVRSRGKIGYLARVQRDCIVGARHVQGNAQKHSNSPSVSGYYVPGVQIK